MRHSPTSPASDATGTASPTEPFDGPRRAGRRRRPPRSRVPLTRRLRYRPRAFVPWLVAGGMAALAGLAVGQITSAAAAARARWGDTRSVLVAARPIEAGDRLGPAVERVERPRAVLPDGALAALPGAHVRATRPLARGEMLTRSVVAPTVGGAAGAGVRPDQRVVAVTQPRARLPVRVGDHVDVWSTLDPSIAGAERTTTSRVAAGAAVVAVARDVVTVAVSVEDTPAVAEASALGSVTLAGVPGGRGGGP